MAEETKIILGDAPIYHIICRRGMLGILQQIAVARKEMDLSDLVSRDDVRERTVGFYSPKNGTCWSNHLGALMVSGPGLSQEYKMSYLRRPEDREKLAKVVASGYWGPLLDGDHVAECLQVWEAANPEECQGPAARLALTLGPKDSKRVPLPEDLATLQTAYGMLCKGVMGVAYQAASAVVGMIEGLTKTIESVDAILERLDEKAGKAIDFVNKVCPDATIAEVEFLAVGLMDQPESRWRSHVVQRRLRLWKNL